MTYSVIAFDPESGAFGVAVQSHWFNVGRTPPGVRFGVGAVVTPALADPSYGWRGLAAMGEPIPADRALNRLLAAIPAGARRQVAFVAPAGRVTVPAGSRCISHAGHVVGEGW